MKSHEAWMLDCRKFAFEPFFYEQGEGSMKKYDVVLTDTSGKEFHYSVDAVGFRSAYTAAKGLHNTERVHGRLPIKKVSAELVS